MSEIYQHTCACGNKYQDDDPDLYICEKCVEKRKSIAAKVDQKIAQRPSERATKSDYQLYEEERASQGVNVRGIRSVITRL